jgi:hypothetical protein
MKRSDLLIQYKQETGRDLFIDLNISDDIVLYIEWLEQMIPSTDEVTNKVNKVIQLRFINELKTRMTVPELLNFDKYISFLFSIQPTDYEAFLELFEHQSMDHLKENYHD